MSSPRVTFNLPCGEGVTELQNLTNLCLSPFAESHQMQQKIFDVSPNVIYITPIHSQIQSWIIKEAINLGSGILICCFSSMIRL